MSLTADAVHVRLGQTEILHDVGLTAEAGQVLALIGPNGAGKSTFLRVAAGLLRPGSGRVLVDDADVHRLPPRERARRIGLVPQDPRLRYPFTVHDIVRMGRYPYTGALGTGHHEDLQRIEHALEATRTRHLTHRSVSTLSSGEHQRVLIARVLAQDPDVYLFDEPTANLDLAQAHHTRHLIQRLAREGKTVIVVAHDLEQASRFADRAVLIARGRVVTHGEAHEVIAPAAIRDAYGVDVEVTWNPGEDGARVRVIDPLAPEPHRPHHS